MVKICRTNLCIEKLNLTIPAFRASRNIHKIFTSPLLSFIFARGFRRAGFCALRRVHKGFRRAGWNGRERQQDELAVAAGGGWSVGLVGTGGAIRRRRPGWAMEERERASIDGERERETGFPRLIRCPGGKVNFPKIPWLPQIPLGQPGFPYSRVLKKYTHFF